MTVDGAGTLLELADPVPSLRRALASRGADRSPDEVRAAFAAEVAYYVPRSHEGRDEASLADLRRRAVAIFLERAGADVEPESFVGAFLDSIEFRPADGAVPALEALRAAGLELACVANWDVSLESHLRRSGLHRYFRAVVSSAEAGAPKPDPAPFLLALERLGVPAARALHVGDDPVDEEGAAAASLAFEPAPLATLPARLGIGGVP